MKKSVILNAQTVNSDLKNNFIEILITETNLKRYDFCYITSSMAICSEKGKAR
jgi:hypothetical protein